MPLIVSDYRLTSACGARISVRAGLKGDTTMDEHTFGWALIQLKSGERVSRMGWNGKNMWLGLQVPDENSKMTLPFIYMSTAQGDLVPWLASQTDMLATDWGLVS